MKRVLKETISMRRNLFGDRITIIDKKGERHENLPAVVDTKTIITQEVKVPIERGDSIERNLPNGMTERFTVINAQYYTGRGRSFPDFYEITYEREGTRPHQPTVQPISVHISDSPQSHVNIDSEDHSINISYGNAGSLFDEIRDLLREAVEDSTELESLLNKVDAMEGSQEAGGFRQAYVSFMSAAADHMTVLAPVLPGLASLLA